MKQPLRFLLAALLATFLLPAARGMTPHYSTLHNFSVTYDANGNATIVSQIISQGYASGCCIPPSTTHQAIATQHWTSGSGVSGGTVYGTRACWTCSLYASSSGTLSVPNGLFDSSGNYIGPAGIYATEDDEGEVDCSIAGVFWNVFQYFEFEIAYTRSYNTGVNQGVTPCIGNPQASCNNWKIAAYCTPATTPPDWNPILLNTPSDYTQAYYADGLTVCARITGTGQTGWLCLATVTGGLGETPLLLWPITPTKPTANCTHTP